MEFMSAWFNFFEMIGGAAAALRSIAGAKDAG
jgi:hypothetical protein